MKMFFYRSFVLISAHVGEWFFSAAARTIATGYFLFKTSARKNGVRFYETLFPGQNRFSIYRYTLRQFTNFTDLFIDRLKLVSDNSLTYTMEGWEHLKSALNEKTGAILLMSHIGNWEAAAHLLHRDLPDLKLLLFMGVQQKQTIEGLQKAHLSQKGVRIVGVDEAGGSPFEIVEGIRFLKSGGFVSMAGDRLWRKDQRAVSGFFLNAKVRVPEAPFVLSLVSGSPIIFFFSFGTGRGKYHFKACAPVFLRAGTRGSRPEAIRRAAQSYLSELESAARSYPFQWYHFEGFF